MKELPKFVQMCASLDKKYLFLALSENGEVFAFSEAYSSSGLGHIPAKWTKMIGEYK